MKVRRLFIDMSLTSILTCILFSLLVSVIFPYITKGQHLTDNSLTVVWLFLISVLPVMFILAPLHFVFLKLGEWAGALLTIIIGTIVVSFLDVDFHTMHLLLSPFYFVPPIFCFISWCIYMNLLKYRAMVSFESARGREGNQ